MGMEGQRWAPSQGLRGCGAATQADIQKPKHSPSCVDQSGARDRVGVIADRFPGSPFGKDFNPKKACREHYCVDGRYDIFPASQPEWLALGIGMEQYPPTPDTLLSSDVIVKKFQRRTRRCAVYLLDMGFPQVPTRQIPPIQCQHLTTGSPTASSHHPRSPRYASPDH